MASRSRERYYIPGTYYHVFNRGVEKRVIFRDDSDYAFFIELFNRYLGKKGQANSIGTQYANYHDGVELLAFALMRNHFHLLVYLKDDESLKLFLHDTLTAYVRYFNDKYDRVGPLFQGRVQIKHILQEPYLLHISRYIHLNPKDWRLGRYTSLHYWTGDKHARWINPERLMTMTSDRYLWFLEDYESYKKSLDIIKAELAEK